MKLKDARDNYYYHSGKTSDLTRQLGLAGVAVVWLFKVDVKGVPTIPSELLLPLVLVVLCLALDLLQYACATAIWGVFNRFKESSGTAEDSDFDAPAQLNWPAIAFFWSKVVAVGVAYWFLLHYLARTIFPK
ncbi:hypothetical protein [Variovorax sp.]|jgi:hypothetical protein|uniref:hypothetical protein n=1 Tax=Variovorax sp. TaxID=1871043 RepID=UPI0037D9E8A3